MDHFLEAVRTYAVKLQAEWRESNLFEHHGNRGFTRERILEEFLRPLLADRYGLGSGEVFSQSGASSKQIDIVVYDKLFSTVFMKDRAIQLFPCETVYGLVEVKSRLTSADLEGSIENIRSLKVLPRAGSTMLDILPALTLDLGAGLTADDTKRNPYLGYIYAHDGLSAATALKYLNRLMVTAEDKQSLPDFVFNYQQGYVICRGRQVGNQVVPSGQGQEYSLFFDIAFPQEEVLMMLYLTLNIQINQTRLKIRDLNSYWKDLVNHALLDS